MDTPISRAEHNEFVRRMEDEHKRQDKRLALLEESVERAQAISVNVERLATSMENMCREQERQGERLEKLEGRDGEMWRKIVGHIVTCIAGIVVGFIFTQFGV